MPQVCPHVGEQTENAINGRWVCPGITGTCTMDFFARFRNLFKAHANTWFFFFSRKVLGI